MPNEDTRGCCGGVEAALPRLRSRKEARTIWCVLIKGCWLLDYGNGLICRQGEDVLMKSRSITSKLDMINCQTLKVDYVGYLSIHY